MAYQAPGVCPICGHVLHVTRLTCTQCDSQLEGDFTFPRLARLSPEHQYFVEVFLRAEGKLNRVQELLGISYPTARARLLEVIRALGYETATLSDTETAQQAEARKAILKDIAAGRLTVEEALKKLKATK